MKRYIRSAVFLSSILIMSVANAEWTYSYTGSFVNTWVVTDGKQSISYNKEKSAKKAAKALNKNEKQTEKVWNDGSEHCKDPLNEC